MHFIIKRNLLVISQRSSALAAIILTLFLVLVGRAEAAGTSGIVTDDMYVDLGTSGGNATDNQTILIAWDTSTTTPQAIGLLRFNLADIYNDTANGGANALSGPITKARLQIHSPACGFGNTFGVTLKGFEDVFGDPTEAMAGTTSFAATLAEWNTRPILMDRADVDSQFNSAQTLRFSGAASSNLVSYLEAQRAGDGIVTFALTPNQADASALGGFPTAYLEDREGTAGGFCGAAPPTIAARLHIADASGPLAVDLRTAGTTTNAVNPVLIWVLFALLLTFSTATIMLRHLQKKDSFT